MFEITLSECTAPRIVIVEGVSRSCLYLPPEKPLTEVKSSGEGKGRVIVPPPSSRPSAGVYACVRALYGRDVAQNCIVTHHQLIHYI